MLRKRKVLIKDGEQDFGEISLPVEALVNFPLPLPGSKLEHFNSILLSFVVCAMLFSVRPSPDDNRSDRIDAV